MKEQHWFWPGVREIFFEDLKKLHEKCGPWDLILFTGDLTQRGSVEEFQRVNVLLDQLWAHFDKLGSSPKLLAVPGNHDLVRPRKKGPAVKLLQQWLNQPDIQEEFWKEVDSPYRQVVIKAFEHYTAWWNAQPLKVDNVNTGILPGDFSATIEKEEAKLGIVGLNTSFLQLTDDDYKGKIALHARQFHKVCDGDGPAWVKQHHACLLLTHHPPAWLDHDSQQHLYGEIIAGGRFAAHLCGHMHGTVYQEIAEGGTETRRNWQGRSLFGLEYFGKEHDGQRLHGYTGGKIELSKNKGTLMFWPREARLQGRQRNIVPDYSLALTDNQHTTPTDFKLLQPYTIKDEVQAYQEHRETRRIDVADPIHAEAGQRIDLLVQVRLQRKIEEQQKKWDTLSEKLSRLEQERILETRTDEKLRLEHKIEEIKAERQQIEEQLNDLEAKLLSEKEDVSSTLIETEGK